MLWERLRDADFAAAEGWLRTAAELGDVRAAHRLGTLLWRDRNDPQAAVHWLDRAAQADDPAAERDLGIVLREHGDLHGAHHWLSRAAERDSEARQVLAELGAER
jgi:TPR repeat protein